MDREYAQAMAAQAMDRGYASNERTTLGSGAAKGIDPYYGQQQASTAALNKISEPRLTALANRLNMLNERAYEARKRLVGELDRIAGPRPEGSGIDGCVPERMPDAIAVIEGGVDTLEATISEIMDHVRRLQVL